jgi:succinoglycan biosynthesis transport protein ExoP
VLVGDRSLESAALMPVAGADGLWVVDTRSIVPNPTEMLGGHRMRSVVSELAGRFDIVLIDSPPVLPVADALILSGYADGVPLVVAAGQTRRGELRRTAEKLAQASAPLVGLVLNKAGAQRDYGYYGGYQSFSRSAKTTGRHSGGAEISNND